MSGRNPRIALGMLGLDVHTKGIRTLTIRLRDEGFEVIYLGEHLTTEQLVRSAIAEDVDCIGVSFSSAAYVDHCRGLLKEMSRHEADDIPVVVGGLIHADDHPVLRGMGIAGIFGPGSTTTGIADSLRALVRQSREHAVTKWNEQERTMKGPAALEVAEILADGSCGELSDLTVGDLLRRAVARAPERVALKARTPEGSDVREWTYGEVLDVSEAVARALSRRFQPGERVAVFATNVPEWWFLEFGAAMAGLVIVAVNPASKEPELRHVLTDSEAAGIISMSEYRGADIRAMVTRLVSQLPAVRHTCFMDDVAELVAEHRRDPAALPVVGPDDLFMLQYTSGTTGAPKGAMMRHSGVVNTSMFATERFALDEGSVWLNCMPMCHTGGSVHSTLGTLWNVGTMLMVPQFDAGFALQLIEREQANWITTVPTMALRLLDHPTFAERSMSSLRMHACGGAAVAPELVERIEREMGCDFVMLYGQTEMSGMICQTDRPDALEHLTQTVGYPLGPIDVRICAPDSDVPLGLGEVGEICYRGFSVLAGYWGNPEASAAVLSEDGWFRTGDLGTIRPDGYLTINGRLKDMLIRGGENVYPRDIEDQLIDHPAVAEVAVIGVPDPHWGEEIAAVVRLHEGQSIDEAELRSFLTDRISAHKMPRFWAFVDSFPVTLSGKIQKFVLRDELLTTMRSDGLRPRSGTAPRRSPGCSGS